MANKPVNFANSDEFKRMAKAVRAIENAPRVKGQPGPAVPVGSSHSISHFRCTGAYNTEAKGWPGVLTYRNFESVSDPSDWIDGEDVFAEEINGLDLVDGTRYRCHVYGLKEWTRDGDEEGASMFVLVDSPGGGTATTENGCAAAISWRTTNCLLSTVVEATGYCSGISTSQSQRLQWDGGVGAAGGWTAGDNAVDVPEEDFTHMLGVGKIQFWWADGIPRLTIDGKYGYYLGCFGGKLRFSFSDDSLCNGTPGPSCAYGHFVVEVGCSCCTATDGWAGPGWYCVEDLLDPNLKKCVEYSSDPCDDVVILSGPHATAQECEAECCMILGWDGPGWYCVREGAACVPVFLTDDDKCDTDILICNGPHASEVAATAACVCLGCPGLTGFAVTIAGVADGPCGTPVFCDVGAASSGLAAFNGTHTVAGSFTGGVFSPEGGAGASVTVAGGVCALGEKVGGSGTGCACFEEDFIYVSIEAACSGANVATTVNLLHGPDTLATYQGNLAANCTGTLTRTFDSGCGTTPATITVAPA